MTRILKILGVLFLLIPAMCLQNHVYAQGRQITGTVTSSENKQPVQGVTVTVKRTKTSVVTDAQGNFRITADSKATILVFTHTSFTAFEMPISGNTVNAEL